MSSSLDPAQARQDVGPDLSPNCFQRLSADNTSRERVKILSVACHWVACVALLKNDVFTYIINKSIMSTHLLLTSMKLFGTK